MLSACVWWVTWDVFVGVLCGARAWLAGIACAAKGRSASCACRGLCPALRGGSARLSTAAQDGSARLGTAQHGSARLGMARRGHCSGASAPLPWVRAPGIPGPPTARGCRARCCSVSLARRGLCLDPVKWKRELWRLWQMSVQRHILKVEQTWLLLKHSCEEDGVPSS